MASKPRGKLHCREWISVRKARKLELSCWQSSCSAPISNLKLSSFCFSVREPSPCIFVNFWARFLLVHTMKIRLAVQNFVICIEPKMLESDIFSCVFPPDFVLTPKNVKSICCTIKIPRCFPS